MAFVEPDAWLDIAKSLARLATQASTLDKELGRLVESGMPDDAVDLAQARFATLSPVRSVELVHRNVIEVFFDRLLRLPIATQVLQLDVVAPWVTPWSGRASSFDGLLRFMRSRPTLIARIVTRPPEWPSHVQALDRLDDLANVRLYELKDLHAKFLVCEMVPEPFALLGSANVTTQSLSNYEAGIMMRAKGEAEGVVRELQVLASDLRIQAKQR